MVILWSDLEGVEGVVAGVEVAAGVGGKGGGRPDMAQAGGTNPAGLQAALDSVPGWVEQNLK